MIVETLNARCDVEIIFEEVEPDNLAVTGVLSSDQVAATST